MSVEADSRSSPGASSGREDGRDAGDGGEGEGSGTGWLARGGDE